MPRKELPILTGGLIDADNVRADALEENQLQKSDNYEVIGDGSSLTIRKDQQEHGTGVSGSNLNTVLATLFSTSIITISEPYYPPQKPVGMSGDFILFVFGNDGGTYKLYYVWETATSYSVTQLSITGVTYTSSSDVKFFVGEDRVIITDYVNKAHYLRVRNEPETAITSGTLTVGIEYRITKRDNADFTTDGAADNIVGTIFTATGTSVTLDSGDQVTETGLVLSGILGIPAPLNPASFTQLTSFKDSDFETNPDNARLTSPGLVQIVYVGVTENGEMSNPSPVSNTFRIQRFNLSPIGADEKWVDVVRINNLSIPKTGAGSDIEGQLKWFDIYMRVMRYSEDAPANFEFTERVLITDKDNTSGETGNDYALTVPITLGQTPNFENDVAPVANIASQVGGIIALGGIKSIIRFPFTFSRYKKIIIQNKDGRTYVDAVIKLRLFDEDDSDSNKISDLNWDDYDSGGDDQIDTNRINKIRFYDDDLNTALNVVYTLDTSANWCDVYVKIPLLIPGNHIIYLCFGDGSEVSAMAGVDDSNLQTFETGKWHSSANDTWSDQTVFQSEMIKNSRVIDNAPFDFQDEDGRMPNLVNEDNDPTLLNATFKSTEIAAIPDLGDSFLVGDGSIDFTSNQAIVHFAGVGTISAQANGGSGLVRHTDVGHSLKVDETVEISGTTSYNGVFVVVNVGIDTFDLEQTFVANDATGQWRRGYHPFPDTGYIYTRITYAGSDVGVDRFVFGINKGTSLRLDIDFSVPEWEVDDSGVATGFTKISAPQVSSGTGKYFVLLSWNRAAGTVSLFIYDMTNGTLEFEKITYAVSLDESSNFRLGDISGSSKAIPNADYSQCQFGSGRYFDATILADVNAVRNIGNFRPAFENIIGEKLDADYINDGVMDVAVAVSTTGTNWITDADWDVNTTTANKAHCAAAGSSALKQTSNPSVSGVTYLIKFTVSGISAGSIRPTFTGGIDGTLRSVNGTFVEILTSNSTSPFQFATPSGFTGDIDDVTVYALSFNNNVDYSSTIKKIELKQEDNMLKWGPVKGIAFPDLNFKYLREPISAIIPAPSFLKLNYENTFVIFMRNFINRFVLDGDPSKLAARSDVLIEEKTSYGLQYDKTLARAGEDLLWKSEAGAIHWNPEGLKLISEGVISIPEIDTGATMYGFYNPLRNQYLLHNTDEASAGEGIEGEINDADGIGNFEDPDSGLGTYLCVISMGYNDPNSLVDYSPLYVRNTTGTVIDLTILSQDVLRLGTATPVAGDIFDIKVTDASSGAGNAKVKISRNGAAFGSDISVTADGSTYNNDVGSFGFDIIFADTTGSGFVVNDIMRIIIGVATHGQDTYMFNQAGTTNDGLDFGGAVELFIDDDTHVPLIKFTMPSNDMPLKNHIESIENASLIFYKSVGVTSLTCKWHAITLANHYWFTGVKGEGTFAEQFGMAGWGKRQVHDNAQNIGVPWAGSAGCSTSGTDYDAAASTTAVSLSGGAAYVAFPDTNGVLKQNILNWLSDSANNHGMRAIPSGGSSAGRFRSSNTASTPIPRFVPRLAFTY